MKRICTAPKMILKSALEWSPFLFTSTPKWSSINSWNVMAFRHGIITSLLQHLRFWIAFNISLQFMWFFFVLLFSGRPFCLLLHLQHHFKILKSVKTPNSIFKACSFNIIFRIYYLCSFLYNNNNNKKCYVSWCYQLLFMVLLKIY